MVFSILHSAQRNIFPRVQKLNSIQNQILEHPSLISYVKGATKTWITEVICLISKGKSNMPNTNTVYRWYQIKGRVANGHWPYQKGWIFGEVPTGFWSPSPHFRKIMLQFFSSNFRLKKPCLKVQRSFFRIENKKTKDGAQDSEDIQTTSNDLLPYQVRCHCGSFFW